MSVLINGKPLDHTGAKSDLSANAADDVSPLMLQLISPLNRGLLYGHSAFETIAVQHGNALLVDLHLARLAQACQRLELPLDAKSLQQEIVHTAKTQDKAVIRATVFMGPGGRGYQSPPSPDAIRMVSVHPYPEHPKEYWYDGVKLGLSEIRLGAQPHLAGIKHGNRLDQIIARQQWQDDWQEALLLDQHGHVIEATQSNIFALKGNTLLTPDLSECGVAGVMREYVLSQADKVGVDMQIVSLSMSDIDTADALFVTNSVIGLWPIRQLNERHLSDFTFAHKLLNLMIKNECIPNP